MGCSNSGDVPVFHVPHGSIAIPFLRQPVTATPGREADDVVSRIDNHANFLRT